MKLVITDSEQMLNSTIIYKHRMSSNEYKKTVAKNQLAALMNISNSTLRYYLNKEWYDELKVLGYHKSNKILTPRQISFIESKWGELDFTQLRQMHFRSNVEQEN